MRSLGKTLPFLAPLLFVACGAQPVLVPNPHYAQPSGEYGFSETNPILVAGLGAPNRPSNEHLFLSLLRSPAGEAVQFRRLGNCCRFPTPNLPHGDDGLLDRYEVTHSGLAEPVVLYLNMYDPGTVRAPRGFNLAE